MRTYMDLAGDGRRVADGGASGHTRRWPAMPGAMLLLSGVFFFGVTSVGQADAAPAGNWKVLVLIYPQTNVGYLDDAGNAQVYHCGPGPAVPCLSDTQVAQAQNVAAGFKALVESWSNRLCTVTLDVKVENRAINSVTLFDPSYIAGCTATRSYELTEGDVQPELMTYMGSPVDGTGNYDSIIVVWNSGPIPTNCYAGLTHYTPNYQGLALTFSTIPFKHVLPPAGEATGEIMVHEWLHGVDGYYSSLGYSVPSSDDATTLEYDPGHDPVYGKFGLFYRDILQGKVTQVGGTQVEYTGVTPAVWRSGSIRSATHQRPYPCQLLAPVADICTAGTTPTLKWAPVPKDMFRVKVYDTANLAVVAASTETTQNTWAIPPGTLAEDRAYLWTVESVTGGIASTGNDQLTFTTTTAGSLATATFDPDGGAFASFVKVTLTCATPDVQIHFTTSGADPTPASPWVSSGSQVTVLAPATLKAQAINGKCTPSTVASAQYTSAPTNVRMVTNTDNSGLGSLRQAITDANLASDVDQIVFDIPGGGVHTITPASSLPAITSPVIIDGWTQPGFAGTPLIELNGAGAGAAANGLQLSGGNSIVRGLIVNRFGGIGIDLGAGGGNIVVGNYIGTNAGGTAAAGNGAVGVYVEGPDNLIGGPEPAWRNVISGNYRGVQIIGAAATRNSVLGNYVGTDVSGTIGLGNADDGIFVYAAPGNTVGGLLPGQHNVISGNDAGGVEVSGSGANGNLIEGNYIGTNAAGNATLGNTSNGVVITADTNTIRGNVISGSGLPNVGIQDAQAVLVAGNYIGTNAGGTSALTNGQEGVVLENAMNATIGGTTSDFRNVISGNGFSGVVIAGPSASGNIILGNFIGTDATGLAAVPNGLDGVLITKSFTGGATPAGNTIGGSAPGAGNVISGNSNNGVTIAGAGVGGNLVQGNLIGTDVTGMHALGNARTGVRLTFPTGYSDSAVGNLVGGAGDARNVVSGNGTYGIAVIGNATGVSGNLIKGNYVGTNITGTAALPNVLDGVLISTNIAGGAATSNTIGGVAGEGNLISGNTGSGVRIDGSGATSNQLYSNLVGTDTGGTFGVPNGGDGVTISGTNNAVGGGTNVTNTIAFNGGAGVAVTAGTGNLIRVNSMFSNGGLGIDLGANGVTANDDGDGDSGPNNLQNFPILTAAIAADTGLTIYGTFNSTPNTAFDLDFYSNSTCDPSASGEGEAFIGTTHVTTNGDGNLNFSLTGPPVPAGQFITAAATDPGHNSSELSPCMLASAASSGPTYTVTYLTPGNFSQAVAINNAGQIALCMNDHAWLWDNGALTDLGTLGGSSAYPTDIDDRGEIVGSSTISGSSLYHAFRWSAAEGMVDLGTLGGEESYATGINNAGRIVGYAYVSGNSHGGLGVSDVAMWVGGAIQDFGPTRDLAFEVINGNNQVAGQWRPPGHQDILALLWHNGVFQTLGGYPGGFTFSTNISSAGHVVGATETPDRIDHAFFWNGGSFMDINGPDPGIGSTAYGINGLDQVVGTYNNVAFIWENGVWADLNSRLPVGACDRLNGASDINDAGQIIADATDEALNESGAVLLTPSTQYNGPGSCAACCIPHCNVEVCSASCHYLQPQMCSAQGGAAQSPGTLCDTFICPRPVLPGNFDGDGDVDSDDLNTFMACLTGPGVAYNPAALPLGCTLTPDADGKVAADFDHDGDVDLSDFGIFQRCYTGRNQPASPTCAN